MSEVGPILSEMFPTTQLRGEVRPPYVPGLLFSRPWNVRAKMSWL